MLKFKRSKIVDYKYKIDSVKLSKEFDMNKK